MGDNFKGKVRRNFALRKISETANAVHTILQGKARIKCHAVIDHIRFIRCDSLLFIIAPTQKDATDAIRSRQVADLRSLRNDRRLREGCIFCILRRCICRQCKTDFIISCRYIRRYRNLRTVDTGFHFRLITYTIIRRTS